MPDSKPNSAERLQQLERALSQWDTEGGAALRSTGQINSGRRANNCSDVDQR